eukprot:SAG31_NODE_249_length_19118_cov_47.456195_8_plen_78_part_00
MLKGPPAGPETMWQAGSTQIVAMGVWANHGGGEPSSWRPINQTLRRPLLARRPLLSSDRCARAQVTATGCARTSPAR